MNNSDIIATRALDLTFDFHPSGSAALAARLSTLGP